MTVYVMRDGRLVDKDLIPREQAPVGFPMPRVSRLEPFESPVTGKNITSWRQRDRDMQAADAVDPRDLPRAPFEKRDQDNARLRSIE